MIKVSSQFLSNHFCIRFWCCYCSSSTRCFPKYRISIISVFVIVINSMFRGTAGSDATLNSGFNSFDKFSGQLPQSENLITIPTNLISFTGEASSSPMKGWMCHCWNSTNQFEEELECRCEGDALVRIPQKLHKAMQRLTIASAGLPLLRNTGLKVYASSLRDITLTDLSHFESIQPGAFDTIKNLRTIYIAHAPKLTYLSKDVFSGISKNIKTIRIIDTGLVKIPDMRYLSTGSILHMVDLEGNRINHIESKSVRIKTEQLILDNNVLTMIDNSAFYGSEIAKLSLKGNTQLQYIHESAFVGIINIQELDLSNTALIDLPSNGLQGLEVLRVQNTHSLKTVPSIYNFKNLQVAWLTHSFHCCAFKFPSRHDPSRHAKRLKYLESLQRACLSNGGLSGNQQNTIQQGEDNLHSNADGVRFSRSVRFHASNLPRRKLGRKYIREAIDNSDTFFSHFEVNSDSSQNFNQSQSDQVDRQGNVIQAIRGSQIVVISKEETSPDDHFIQNQDFGEFHETTADLAQNNLDAMCGNLTQKKIDVSCFPMPNALNPCEDVMGSYWLRASVWVVVLLAVVGNVAVLIVLLSSRSDTSVPKFLMNHLAFADLCMGLYLLLIASIDAHSMGEYFNYAFDWQYGTGCKVAGFLTVFASHLSVFTLTVITLERWFAITHAIYLNKRIKIGPARYIMTIGWIYSFFMAALPLLGFSNYSSTSICLPMEARDSLDVTYLVSVLGINGTAFFIIAICYAQIYFSLGKETRRVPSTGEMTIAKKMALLVFTNFSCWAPIAFFGLTALAGYPLINVTKSKILLVFFYPLNSCADPYLYAILTSQYRRDLYMLLSKFGVCKQKAAQYKSSFSLPVTNQSIPVHSRRRSSASPQKPEIQQMLNHEDFV